MRISALLTCLAIAVLGSTPSLAQTGPEAQIKAELGKQLREASIDSVRKVPYGNLYEVVANGEIFYTDEKGSFLLLGPIIDMRSKENITEARLRQVNAIKFDALKFDNAIKIVRGNGSRRVALFEDPNCGYCKRFERDLLGVSDITVYVFLYPILSPDSVQKARGVWCSADRGKVWLDIMTRDAAAPTAGACNTPLDETLAFGRDKKINGTPTVIFENGERIPGAMSMAELEKRLVAARVPAPSASSR